MMIETIMGECGCKYVCDGLNGPGLRHCPTRAPEWRRSEAGWERCHGGIDKDRRKQRRPEIKAIIVKKIRGVRCHERTV